MNKEKTQTMDVVPEMLRPYMHDAYVTGCVIIAHRAQVVGGENPEDRMCTG
jgi:hypothetical protein